MFTSDTLEFLRDLSANNTRDWFADNKPRYEAHVKGPAREYAAQMEAEFARAFGMAHRARIFRINRDVRFSKGKTPYNTHVHFSFAGQGGSAMSPLWMMGLAPGYLTFGCGLFAFDKPGLDLFRDHVAGPNGEAFADMLKALQGQGARLSEPDLKRVPAPHDKDHPLGYLLRHKGLVGWIDAADPSDATKPDVIDRSMDAFKALRPLHSALMEL